MLGHYFQLVRQVFKGDGRCYEKLAVLQYSGWKMKMVYYYSGDVFCEKSRVEKEVLFEERVNVKQLSKESLLGAENVKKAIESIKLNMV